MSLPLFIEHDACTSRAHCRDCRDPIWGKPFALGMARTLTMPAPDSDGLPACPIGRRLGFKPEDEPKPRKTEPVQHIPSSIDKYRGWAPGNLVHSILQTMGYRSSTGCGCVRVQMQMNDWGYLGCLRHRRELIDWFSQKAKEAGLNIDRKGIRALIIAGIIDQWRKFRGPVTDDF